MTKARSWRRVALGGACLTALLAMAPGLALAADDAAAKDDKATQVDDVVVTAQFRAAPVQTVPLSITAIDTQSLEDKGAQQIEDYARSIPGLSFANRGPNRAQVVVRGISNITGESTVGIYFDEIAQSNNFNNPDFGLFDIDRVEILRGPQGTLYGQGSLGGTIRIFTVKPQIGTFESKLEAIASTTKDGGTNGALNAVVNIPAGDKAALRISGFDHSEEGWVDNLYNGEDNVNWHHRYGARIAGLVQVTPDFDIQGIINYQHDRIGLLDLQDRGIGRYNVFRGSDQGELQKNIQYTAIANYHAPFGTLTEIVGYNDEKDDRGVDPVSFIDPALFGFDLRFTSHSKVFTSETRFVSDFQGPFNFVAGAYYEDRQRNNVLTLVNGGLLFGLPGDYVNGVIYDNKIYALFGEAHYDITDKLQATAGLRWSSERVESPFFQEVGGLVLQQSDLSGTYSAATPKFGLSYQATPDLLWYANIAEGYRAGGVNQIIPIPPDPNFVQTYKPDRAWSYETGIKSQWLDRRLTANLGVYYIKWTDMQILGIPTNPSLGFTTNAGAAHSEGFEAEFIARPMTGLELDFSAGYTKAELDDAAQGAPAGTALPYVPKWGVSAAAQYEWPLTSTWDGFARVDWSHKSDTNGSVPPDPISAIPAYDIVNARLGMQNDRFGIFLFGNNLTNSLGITAAAGSGEYITRPRTFGVDLRAKF